MADDHEAIWATEGLFVIADAIKARREDQDLLVLERGMEEFVCPTFEMRSYCSCEGSTHPDGCPANFVFHPAGFWVTWHNYVGRNQVSNRPKPPGLLWELAVADCIKAVAAWTPQRALAR